jgi:predicted RNA-binding protein with RPS1 domain
VNKYERGKIVKCNVTGIEKYGIFVNLDNYYSGLIHISEISDGFVRNINDYAKIGETIYAKVIDVDELTSHVRLSIKDIDYRIEGNRRETTRIKEVGTGFDGLKHNRDVWIKEKLKELV